MRLVKQILMLFFVDNDCIVIATEVTCYFNCYDQAFFAQE